MTRRRPIVLAVCLLSLAACSNHNPEDQDSAAGASTSSPAVAAPVIDASILHSAPLDVYRLSISDAAAITWAGQIVSNRCMQRFGFHVPGPVIDKARVAEQERIESERKFGVVDASIASTYGYGFPATESATSTSQPEQSPAFLFVLTGQKDSATGVVTKDARSPGKVGGLEIPPGGCNGEGRTAIWGNPSNILPLHVASDLAVQAGLKAQADSRTRAADKAWSDCMGVAGYRLANPQSVDPPTNDGSREKAPLSEVQQALADIDCKAKVRYIQIRHDVQVEYENMLIEQNQLALDEEGDLKEKALLRSATIVEQGN